jgi:hypothetical protein
MGSKAIKYSAVLIGIYLAVAYATGAGKLVTSVTSGASRYARTLQGR